MDKNKNIMIKCPKCGSNKIDLVDQMPLALNNKSPYIDNELYVMAKCFECKNRFELIGEITYKLR